MRSKSSFFSTVCTLAIPVALQSMLQSSFSIVDQIMIGQLGEVSIAGVGQAGKFSSVFSVLIAAVGAVAGIMLAQYLGQENRAEVRRSFFHNLWVGLAAALGFTALCLFAPDAVLRLYTTDPATQQAGAEYLSIIAWTFLPMTGATMLCTLYRCAEKPRLPLYASIVSALLNTVVNYVLIFGKCGFAPMGARGAAIATVIAQAVNFLLMLLFLPQCVELLHRPAVRQALPPFHRRQYLEMLLPILLCEVAWSLGENVYAAIYGRMGTQASAAMTLTNPVQGLVIGALCGLSQAAGVIVGKLLGTGEYEEAYAASKKLLRYGLAGALILSAVVVALSPLYVRLYQVDASVRLMTRQLLFAYAVIVPVKILNMILGGGIIRSGGKTKYVMLIDIIGTWCFGVPLGLLGAFVLHLSLPWVYFILSLEECFRLCVSLIVFRRRRWMQSLEAAKTAG